MSRHEMLCYDTMERFFRLLWRVRVSPEDEKAAFCSTWKIDMLSDIPAVVKWWDDQGWTSKKVSI